MPRIADPDGRRWKFPQQNAMETERFEVLESPLGVVYSRRHHPRCGLDLMVPVDVFPYHRLRERGIRDLLALHGQLRALRLYSPAVRAVKFLA